MVTAEVPNTTDMLVPGSRTCIKVAATAPGAPVAMALAARGHVVGVAPSALHTGATASALQRFSP